MGWISRKTELSTRQPGAEAPAAFVIRGARSLFAALVVLLSLGFAGLPPAAAATDAGAAGVTIVAGEPVAQFPQGLTFPVQVTSDEEIAAVDLLYHPAYVETLNQVGLDFAPGKEASGSYDLDLRDGSIPPGVEIRYRWRVTQADGDIAETEEQGVIWRDTRFEWVEIASPRVTVNAYNGDPAFNQQVLESAEATIDKLAKEFGAQMTHPIRIWVYNSHQDFAGSLAPNSEPWIVGAAYPWLGLINAVLPPGNMNELGRVIPHEMSHQVLFQATKNPFNQPPGWLEEGLATIAQTGGRESLWREVAAAAQAGQLDDIQILNGQFPYDSGDALLAYGESMSIVTYIIDTYGQDRLSALIAVFRDGVTFDEAVQQSLGISLRQLSDDWQAAALEQSHRELDKAGATPTAGFSDFGGGMADLLASGALVLAVVVALGMVGMVRARRRAQREWDGLDDDAP
ncbi:MAG: peptidase MA family metallohydrolase, partial [Thermomicrobiales bacterium]